MGKLNTPSPKAAKKGTSLKTPIVITDSPPSSPPIKMTRKQVPGSYVVGVTNPRSKYIYTITVRPSAEDKIKDMVTDLVDPYLLDYKPLVWSILEHLINGSEWIEIDIYQVLLEQRAMGNLGISMYETAERPADEYDVIYELQVDQREIEDIDDDTEEEREEGEISDQEEREEGEISE